MSNPLPIKCPACNSDEVDVLTAGLWDGVDKAGRGTGGIAGIGTCKTCGAHFDYFSVQDRDAMEVRYGCDIMTGERWEWHMSIRSGGNNSAA